MLDFDSGQNVFVAVILVRFRAFSRVVVMCWRHEVVNLFRVVLLSSNLAWSKVSISFSLGVYIAVVICRYIRS